ncbi:hypothetical protein B0I33_11134 [Prauserella shujinwangii]|uniref:Uncharacterized protein n=1 Tax=Prauserella shujinwangii TaxID=1453103 RepID=A0A2T0LMW3_9PSEU|nr:hypothetical protein B0I33_11134 [Prauserella shujinwangii]
MPRCTRRSRARPPFGEDEDNSLALLHRVAAGTLAPPRRAGSFEPVLMGMLRAEPGERLTANQVREAAQAVATGNPVPEALAEAAGGWPTQPLTAVTAVGPMGTRLDAVPVGPAPGAVTAAPGPAPRSRGVRPLLAGGAGLLVVLLAGVVLLTQLDWGDSSAAREPAPSTTTTTSRALSAAELEKAVAGYYALLPERTGEAWARLGPAPRAEGRQAYESHWARVTRLAVVSPPRRTAEDLVHVGVRLTLRNGAKVTEFHQHGLAVEGGRLLIVSDTLLHSERTAAPDRPPRDQDEKKDDEKKDDEKKDDEKKDEGRGKDKEDENGGRGRGGDG